MSLRIVKIALAVVLAFPCAAVVAIAADDASVVPPDGVKGNRFPILEPHDSAFKLKAGGQIDLESSTVSFAGEATHLGQFTATGTYDPDSFTFQGTMIGGSGDTLAFTATFETQPSGEIVAHLSFVGGAGRLFLSSGNCVGTLTLDDDHMFTLVIEGTFRKCVRDATRSCL